MNTTTFTVGQIVEFKVKTSADFWPNGAPVQMEVIESYDNGKCLVKTLNTGMRIAPTYTYFQSDLIAA
jgi:hypothetical protein